MRKLALLGGDPVWTKGWPKWPITSDKTACFLQEVLESGRWAISGQWSGQESWDQRFNRQFANYVGVNHCFTVDHGSSALLVAFLALDLGPGDEVIVPSLTWVACASAVMRVGAVPIFADISPESLCIDPSAIEAAITDRTRCILVVHLYSCMADMDRIEEIAIRHELPIVEDCAQAHGAEWRGRRSGSLGLISVFSMQQGKALTSGEGGAVLTNDSDLADRLERLRCDGRRYTQNPHIQGLPDLEEVRGLQGMNLCLSEFQAALLCDGLSRLDAQIDRRAACGASLDKALGQSTMLQPIKPYSGNTRRAYYHYAIRISRSVTSRISAVKICEALSAELGTRVHLPYIPLPRHPLFAPNTLHALPHVRHSDALPLTVAEDQSERTVLLHHSLLLCDDAASNAIIDAFRKVFENLDALEAWCNA